MPPRLNKRQQREVEELQALAGQSNIEKESESEDEETLSQSKSGPSGFAALFTTEDDEEEEEDEQPKSRSKKSKKKKKTTTSVPDKPAAPATAPAAPLPKNEKKAAKKAKAKAKKSGMDEIDAALEALSAKHPEFKRNTDSGLSALNSTMARSLSSLLSVNPAHLDSEAELKRFFGAKVVAANRDKPSGGSASSSKRAHITQRSILTKPQASWAPAHMREGLSARQLTEEEINDKLARNEWDDGAPGEKWWTVEYSKRYKGMTMAFLQVVLSGDPQGFYNLLQRAPWHADSWLQLAEVFRHREEHSSAVDAVDRAMFAYERAFVGGFSFTNGTNRLDFARVENRPFFLAVHRQASDLQRRGCMRTAFEFTKLMYSLDPWGDPHGALFHLEFLAFKAGMSQWLLDVFNLFDASSNEKDKPKSCRMDPSVLPGWAYSRALALQLSNKEQDKSASTAALIEAADSFPSVVPLLADKLDVTLPASIRGHRDFRIETDCRSLSTPNAILHLLSHIYVQRSFSLWKDPKIMTWFTESLTSHFTSLLSSSLPSTPRRNRFLTLYADNPSLCYSAYRHVLVLESTLSFRSLFPFIPEAVLSGNNTSLACDPLPPPTKVRVSEYGDAFFDGVKDSDVLGSVGARRRMTRREREMEERRLARLIPDVNERRQVQAIFENNPLIQQRFPGPGGVVQFAQALEMLPPDALEDMFAAAVADAGVGDVADNGQMPGQMPGLEDFLFGEAGDAGNGQEDEGRVDEEEEEEEEGEDDEDDDEDLAPMPVRVIRNLLGRFWGGARANANADESDDSDEELRDQGGVD